MAVRTRSPLAPLALAAALSGCGRAPDGLALETALRSAPAVVLWFRDQPLADRAAARLSWCAPAAPELRVVSGAEAARPELPRVLCGARSDEPIRHVLEELARRGSPRLADDAASFLLTTEDPERPGLPLTLLVDPDDERLLARLGTGLASARPRLLAYEEGELTARARLDASGAFVAERALGGPGPLVLRFDEVGWRRVHEEPAAESELEGPALEEAARAARAARELLRPILGRLPAVEVALHPDVSSFVAAARPEPLVGAPGFHLSPGGRAHVLAAEGAAAASADLAAAVVAATARAALGTPLAPWLPEALGVAASGRFRGVELDAWLGHLAAAGALPPEEELLRPGVDRERSPLVLAPARANLLREGGGGLAALDLAALWGGDLAALSARAQLVTPAARPDRRAALRERLPLRGFALGLDPEDADALADGALFDPARLDAALDRAHEAGATAVGLTVLAARLSFDPASSEGLATPVHGRPDDLAVELFVRAAHRAGLAAVVTVTPLAAPTGTYGDAVPFSEPDVVHGFFDELGRVAEHYGLLAELTGVDLLALGAGLRKAARTLPDESWQGGPERLALHEAGWRAAIARARQVWRGPLTMVADAYRDVHVFGLWSELDAVSVELFPRLPAELVGPGPPGEEELVGALRGRLAAAVRLARDMDRPLLVLETGYPARAASWRDARLPLGEPDPDAQRRAAEALAYVLRSLGRHDLEPDGLLLFDLDLDPAGGSGAAADYSLLDGPAAETARRLLGAR